MTVLCGFLVDRWQPGSSAAVGALKRTNYSRSVRGGLRLACLSLNPPAQLTQGGNVRGFRFIHKVEDNLINVKRCFLLT